MEYEWDDAKAVANRDKHGVDFHEAEAFEWDAALIDPDTRRDYGEPRFTALGPIGNRLYVMVYTVRGETLRIISLRKANRREFNRYAET
ncbi:BrnT family toxin [Endothiovibrio diazotrophicus]